MGSYPIRANVLRCPSCGGVARDLDVAQAINAVPGEGLISITSTDLEWHCIGGHRLMTRWSPTELTTRVH